jgi:hypothetical protein
MLKEFLRPYYSPMIEFITGGAKKNLSQKLVKNNLKPDQLESPFFVVATQGNLHVVQLCLKYVPPNQDIVVILNGLEGWEKEWAFEHLTSKGFIVFPFLIDHWMVIDYLLNWFSKPFGLLDEDCFVLDKDCFAKLQKFPERTSFASYYSYTNRKLNLTAPETMFLFLNTPVINEIKKKYRVSSKVVGWGNLKSNARDKLNQLVHRKINL